MLQWDSFSSIKDQAPPLFMPQNSKFKIQILQPGRVYESSRSKYNQGRREAIPAEPTIREMVLAHTAKQQKWKK